MFLRKQIPQEEFDYQALLNALASYRYPRDRITKLLAKGQIIRVKKGLYVFGEDYRRRLISLEILANLIHGPSYISLDSALSHHGIIPEGVPVMTSVCLGRSREFSTPLGTFNYRQVPQPVFSAGWTQYQTAEGLNYLMAVPEKALVDKVKLDGKGITTQKDMKEYLLDDLRIPDEDLLGLDFTRIQVYAQVDGSARIRLLARSLEKLGLVAGGASSE